jgi:hypothetical protein
MDYLPKVDSDWIVELVLASDEANRAAIASFRIQVKAHLFSHE